MESIESVNKASLINDKGVKYLDFRNALAPKYGIIWRDIFLGYLALAVVLVSAAFMQKWHPNWFVLTIVVGGFFVGYFIEYIHLFIHEAAHYNLAGDRKRNDLLSNMFLGLLVGMDVEFFRAQHMEHHRWLGTVKDPEKSYFEAITLRFILESVTGVKVIKVMTHRNKNIKLNQGEGPALDIIKKNNRIFMVAALLNLLFVIGLAVVGFWQVSLVWMLGFGAVFPFFASFRNILEHRTLEAVSTTDYTKVDQGAAHRMFGEGLIASTMGPAGFNRHLLHHWDPQVSYTRLKDVELYLKDTSLRSSLEQSNTSYFKTFLALLNK